MDQGLNHYIPSTMSSFLDILNTESSKTIKVSKGPYNIGSYEPLTDQQAAVLIKIFQSRLPASSWAASSQNFHGRSPIHFVDLPGRGRVVVKAYRRGGIFGKLIRRHYLSTGKTRGRREFEFLHMVAGLGLNVPKPIAYASRGDMFYRSWLITEEILDHENLVDISRQEPERAVAIVQVLAQQVGILIRNRLFHVDLHPGNVVVDKQDVPYIVDFDKAVVFSGTPNELRDRYLRRWRRAVIKHELPEAISEVMCLHLRASFSY